MIGKIETLPSVWNQITNLKRCHQLPIVQCLQWQETLGGTATEDHRAAHVFDHRGQVGHVRHAANSAFQIAKDFMADVIHEGITCDGCGMPSLVEVRLKHGNRYLCQACKVFIHKGIGCDACGVSSYGGNDGEDDMQILVKIMSVSMSFTLSLWR